MIHKINQLGILDKYTDPWLENWMSNGMKKVIIYRSASGWALADSVVPHTIMFIDQIYVYRQRRGGDTNNYIAKFAGDRKIDKLMISDQSKI